MKKQRIGQNSKIGGKYRIDNVEWVMIISFVVFGYIWSEFVIPALTNGKWFTSLIPPVQYIVYNIGWVLMMTAIFGMPMDYFFEGKISIRGILWGGMMSFTIFAVWDLYQPPFAYDWNGTLVITNSEALPGAAADTALGWVWTWIGIKGHALYLAVYRYSPIIAITIDAIALKPDQLLKLFQR